jgi:NADPH:quinone reductase-like Zn-dependent oxidoreductase
LSAGIQYPRVPGHEVAGIIDEVAEGVAGWTEANGSELAGTAGTAGTANPAGVVTLLPAKSRSKSPASPTTAATHRPAGGWSFYPVMERLSRLSHSVVLVWDAEKGQEHLLAVRGLDRVRPCCDHRSNHLWITWAFGFR